MGVAVVLNGGAITWTSKQHDVVALSTIEAEYVTLNRAAQIAVHFRHLHNVRHHQHGPTNVYEDNEGAVKLANNKPPHRPKKLKIKHQLQCIKK
jgi:hypothetical protein